MRIDGAWFPGEDKTIRPIVPGLVRLANGEWLEVSFLLDGGADRTVFSAAFLGVLQPMTRSGGEEILISGVGGAADSITIDTAIGFIRDDGQLVTVRGTFSVFAQAESADLSVLGRDVTNNFTVVYDYPQRIIALLAPPHSCEIKSSA
ncbi:MAG: hypothetical protein QOH70_3697 [Blastocatellia bacterium]|jgi:hypothetical protein|nr:hypothetical protein [Blastocatellia bacterium]